MQSLVAVFHTVCAHVEGPKNFFGTLVPRRLRTGWLTPENTSVPDVLPFRIWSPYVKLWDCQYNPKKFGEAGLRPLRWVNV